MKSHFSNYKAAIISWLCTISVRSRWVNNQIGLNIPLLYNLFLPFCSIPDQDYLYSILRSILLVTSLRKIFACWRFAKYVIHIEYLSHILHPHQHQQRILSAIAICDLFSWSASYFRLINALFAHK